MSIYKNIGGWSFTELNKDTKKAQRLIENYENYEGLELWDVYGSHSYRKEQSYNDIKELVKRANGWGLCITSHCTCFYTCAFMLELDGVGYLAYITPSYNYLIRL